MSILTLACVNIFSGSVLAPALRAPRRVAQPKLDAAMSVVAIFAFPWPGKITEAR
jgi:hypothetical protein